MADLPCVSYVDDILVRGRNKEEHDSNLGLVLQRLNAMHLHVNDKKMQLAREKILFLGYDIQAEVIHYVIVIA